MFRKESILDIDLCFADQRRFECIKIVDTDRQHVVMWQSYLQVVMPIKQRGDIVLYEYSGISLKRKQSVQTIGARLIGVRLIEVSALERFHCIMNVWLRELQDRSRNQAKENTSVMSLF